jgi:hypothetical protein
VEYFEFYKSYEGEEFNQLLYEHVINGSSFLSKSTFFLSHWLLAFNLFALATRVGLAKRQISPDFYDCRLKTANIVVSLINVLLPAADWVMWSHTEYWKIIVILGLS